MICQNPESMIFYMSRTYMGLSVGKAAGPVKEREV